MEEVWVEHKVLGAEPRKVSKYEFEKLLGSKGWSLCEPPARETSKSFETVDPGREEFRRAQQAIREMPVFDPAAERQAELKANNLARVLEDIVVDMELADEDLEAIDYWSSVDDDDEIIFEPDPGLLDSEELDE